MSDTISTKDEVSIAWEEELKELNPPIMASNFYIAELYKRSNALLRRLNEQEQIIIGLMRK